jgi:hypothetical protein
MLSAEIFVSDRPVYVCFLGQRCGNDSQLNAACRKMRTSLWPQLWGDYEKTGRPIGSGSISGFPKSGVSMKPRAVHFGRESILSKVGAFRIPGAVEDIPDRHLVERRAGATPPGRGARPLRGG